MEVQMSDLLFCFLAGAFIGATAMTLLHIRDVNRMIKERSDETKSAP